MKILFVGEQTYKGKFIQDLSATKGVSIKYHESHKDSVGMAYYEVIVAGKAVELWDVSTVNKNNFSNTRAIINVSSTDISVRVEGVKQSYHLANAAKIITDIIDNKVEGEKVEAKKAEVSQDTPLSLGSMFKKKVMQIVQSIRPQQEQDNKRNLTIN